MKSKLLPTSAVLSHIKLSLCIANIHTTSYIYFIQHSSTTLIWLMIFLFTVNWCRRNVFAISSCAWASTGLPLLLYSTCLLLQGILTEPPFSWWYCFTSWQWHTCWLSMRKKIPCACNIQWLQSLRPLPSWHVVGLMGNPSTIHILIHTFWLNKTVTIF